MKNFNKAKDTIGLVSKSGQDVDIIACFPIGTASISAVLKKAEYNVKVLDLNLNTNLESDILNHKIVMLTLSAGPVLSFALDKIEEIKAQKDKIVIVGGPLVMAMPERVLKETKADFLLYGDTENSLIKLMKYLEGKEKLENIKGVGYRKNNKIIINPPDITKDLDSLPLPDLESFEVETYVKYIDLGLGVRTLNWYTSRGCPFNCQFCFHEKHWRGQSAQKIVKDLKYIKTKYNIEGFYFLDDNFMCDINRINEFCKLVKPLNIKWGCEARVTSLNEDILKLMKASGCTLIRNGFESGSDRILKVMQKGLTVESIRNVVKLLIKVGIHVKGGFMFGVPTETKKDAKKTVKLIKWIFKMSPSANIWTYFYTPRPGTAWYNLAVQKGMKEFTLRDWTDLDKYQGLFFNMSKLSEKQIKRMIKTVGFHNFLAKPDKIKKLFKKFIK